MSEASVAAPERHVIDSTDGVRTVAWDFGGDGVPIVFCHATGFHSRVWDPVIEFLGPDVRAVSIDLRGHGDSSVPEGVGYAWTGMANDILSVVDHLDLGTGLGGVGHSMGGASILLAESMRPGLFDRAWLFEPITVPSDYPRDESHMMAGARRRRNVFASADAAFERYMSRPPFNTCDHDVMRHYVDYGFKPTDDGEVTLKCPGEVEAQVFEGAVGSGLFELLPHLHTRTTVVGSGDGNLPAAVAPLAAAVLPNATYINEADLTHFGPLAAPERLAKSIRAALL